MVSMVGIECAELTHAAANAIAAGAGYGLLAASFTLISRSGRFFHLAQGALFAVGGYGAFVGSQAVGLPGLAFGVVAACSLGAATEWLVYRPLRRQHASPLVLMLSSLGIFLIIQSAISLYFGKETLLLLPSTTRVVITGFLGSLSIAQVLNVMACAIVSIVLWAMFSLTSIGRTMRAVAGNPELAKIVGVKSDRTVLEAMIIGSALAGVSGILAGYDLNLEPTMGMRAVLVSVAAAVIGGMRNPLHAVLGGLVLGLMEGVTAWIFPARLQDVTMYTMIAIILLIKPSRVFNLAVEQA